MGSEEEQAASPGPALRMPCVTQCMLENGWIPFRKGDRQVCKKRFYTLLYKSIRELTTPAIPLVPSPFLPTLPKYCSQLPPPPAERVHLSERGRGPDPAPM